MRTAIINLLLTLSLVAILLLSPPIIDSLYRLSSKEIELEDSRINLPNYEGEVWVSKHLKEFSEIGTQYYDYVVYRRNDYIGETINIKDGNRISFNNSQTINSKNEFWFFGGSTTWGTGVRDGGTYPSKFAETNSVSVINYGESGYIARQSLAKLANEYLKVTDKSKKRWVVFYDGINDIFYRCSNAVNNIETSSEQLLQEMVNSNFNEKWTYKRTFGQLQDLLVALFRRIPILNISQIKDYNCQDNIKKAEFVASSLVDTWFLAQSIALANGDNFLAILQPVAYLGSPRTDHINIDSIEAKDLAEQYKAVYPLIRKFAKKRQVNFVDFTEIFDSEEYYYIDHFHVSENAHDLLVKELNKYLNHN